MSVQKAFAGSTGSVDIEVNSVLSAGTGPSSGSVRKRAIRQLLAEETGSTQTALKERIERAHRMFVSRAHAKVDRAAEISSMLETESPNTKSSILKELQTIAHSISGTAGSFGYNRLSEIADELEITLASGRAEHRVIVDLVIEMVVDFLGSVARKTQRD